MSEIVIYIISAFLAFIGFIGYGAKKKNEGKKEIKNDLKNNALNKVIKSNEIDSDINNISDNDVKRQLFDKYGNK